MALAALVLGGGAAMADPTTAKTPVALRVDVSEQQLPQAAELKGKQFDLNGLPVVLGSGPSNRVGLQTGRHLDLGAGFSVNANASAARLISPGAVLARDRRMGEMTAGTTARFQQSGWDIALFPEISSARLAADRLPNYVMGGSVARKGAGDWSVETTSRYELRRTDTLTGAAGSKAQGQFGLTHLPLFGAQLDLGYVYDWSQPSAEAATLSHGPSVALDLGLSDALNCRVAYHYAFAGAVTSATPGFAWLGDGGQDLTVGWDWDLAAQGIRGTTFSAGFAYHQDFFATAAPGMSSGGLNLAMTF
jgi:hypothetical protein